MSSAEIDTAPASSLPLKLLTVLRLLVGGWFLLDVIAFALRPGWGGAVTAFVQSSGAANLPWFPYSTMAAFLESVVAPNPGVFGFIVFTTELMVALALLLGVWTRAAAAVALLLNFTFAIGRGFWPAGPHGDAIFIAIGLGLLHRQRLDPHARRQGAPPQGLVAKATDCLQVVEEELRGL